MLDGEDDFVNMLRHVLGVLGPDQQRGPPRRTYAGRDRLSTASTWSSSGPGPATRATTTTRRCAPCARRSTGCWRRGQPFLAVCLGHQALCQRLGIPLGFKDIVFQGTQSPVSASTGRTERVGFYNTFVGRAGPAPLPDGVGRGRPRVPATSTWSAGRTSAASSSTPSRSSPSTATT